MSNLTTVQKLAILVIAWLILSHGIAGAPPPFAATKFSVLIVEETDQRAALTAEQLNILNGIAPGSVRDFVTTHGGDFRLLDKDNDVSQDADWVKAAWAVADKTHLPSIVAATPKAGVKPQGPLVTTADTLKLLSPLGGP